MEIKNFREGLGKAIREVVATTEDIFSLIGVLSIFLMMVLITANTAGRYILDSPISGVNTFVTIYLMLILVFFTFSSLHRDEGNICADVLYDEFSNVQKAIIDTVGNSLALITFAILSYLTADEALFRLEIGATSAGAVPFPVGLSWIIIPIGCILLCIRFGILIYDDLITITRSLWREE